MVGAPLSDTTLPSIIYYRNIKYIVNTIQKCHWVCKAGMSLLGATVARLCSPETPHIEGLKSLAGIGLETQLPLFGLIVECSDAVFAHDLFKGTPRKDITKEGRIV